MKRYRRWLGGVLLAFFSVVASASAEMKLLKAQYLGHADDRGVYLVRVLGRGELPVEVRFTAKSDPASRAIFEKLVDAWLFRSDLGEVGIRHDATLTLTLVCEESTGADLGPLPVALRGVQLEFPFVIHAENMEDENYLAGNFLVHDALALFSGSISEKECASFTKMDAARLSEFKTRVRRGSRNELVLYERMTPQRGAMLRNRAEERKVKPSKLRQQVEELRDLLAQLEQADGGCKVGELRAYGGDFGFSVEVPSLAAAGTEEGNGVMILSLVQAMDRDEWWRSRNENEKLFAESDAVQQQYLQIPADVRTGKRKPAVEQQKVLDLRRNLMDRLRATFDVPMARYKNLGLIVSPPLAAKVDRAGSDAALMEARVNFYRKISRLVDFYDLEEVLTRVRATADKRNGTGK